MEKQPTPSDKLADKIDRIFDIIKKNQELNKEILKKAELLRFNSN